jgi:hypothetical protein
MPSFFCPCPQRGWFPGAAYDALREQGGVVEREHVRFGKWPVQILTDANALIGEAIRESVEVQFDGIPTRVFRPEHLCAVALQVGRSKDYLRVTMFLEEGSVDTDLLVKVLQRHGLDDRLNRMNPGLLRRNDEPELK